MLESVIKLTCNVWQIFGKYLTAPIFGWSCKVWQKKELGKFWNVCWLNMIRADKHQTCKGLLKPLCACIREDIPDYLAHKRRSEVATRVQRPVGKQRSYSKKYVKNSGLAGSTSECIFHLGYNNLEITQTSTGNVFQCFSSSGPDEKVMRSV